MTQQLTTTTSTTAGCSDTQKRKRGRPRSFDRTTALEQAMKVFWQKGFDAASIDDLTDAMAISRPSLYAAFGDKETLFGEALGYYGESIAKPAQTTLECDAPIDDALTRFFRTSLEGATGEIKGCFSNCASTMAPCGSTLAEQMRSGAAGIISAFEARLGKAQDRGEIAVDIDVRERANLMFDLLGAQAHRARMGFNSKDLAAQIPCKVRAIIG